MLLALAVADLHVAWLQVASGEPRSSELIERALVVVDELAGRGRRDAAAVARWARELLASG